jgi:hypothetical protein
MPGAMSQSLSGCEQRGSRHPRGEGDGSLRDLLTKR